MAEPGTDRKSFRGTLSEWLEAIKTTSLFKYWHYSIMLTTWAACICLISDKISDLGIETTLLTVFGTCLGFIISFRTSSAFERYNESKKLLSAMTYASRTFARTVWFHTPLSNPEKGPKADDQNQAPRSADIHQGSSSDSSSGSSHGNSKQSTNGCCSDIAREKRDVIELIEHFSVAVKDHLREERLKKGELEQPIPRSHKYDMEDLAEKGGSYLPPESRAKAGETNDSPGHDENMNPLPYREESINREAGRTRESKVENRIVPLEITYYLSSYITLLQKRDTNTSTINVLFATLNLLVQSFTDLEKVSADKIPRSYRFQLRLYTVLYIFFLPFQLWTSLRYITIPGTFFASLIFLGILSAGEEIENPLDGDPNDPDVDRFCKDLYRELEMIKIDKYKDASLGTEVQEWKPPVQEFGRLLEKGKQGERRV
ncbi:unnamed protein product [Rhizoctonia solani]|uniref:Uncharacterized protein n=1 Tax=Rhizoctonia solani TaxID=456999 RepID=A0A8H3AX93_9AGAM|nr:unnamed protein product [Rhizoctonia solani]